VDTNDDYIIFPVGNIAKKQSEGVRFLLIRHQKYTPTDCFFGDFAYWEGGKDLCNILFCGSMKYYSK